MTRILHPLALVAVLIALAALPAPAPAQGMSASDTTWLGRVSASRIKGDPAAKVTIVELSDFQCPFCREFARNTLARLDSAYIQTGKARLVYFNFPLPNHRRAWVAAEAALCAGAQGAFWPMHDLLFARQEEWSADGEAAAHFERYAGEVGVKLEEFRTCTRDDLVAPLLSADLMQAAGTGANSTPSFILNGEKLLSGAQPFEEFQRAIEELLAK